MPCFPRMTPYTFSAEDWCVNSRRTENRHQRSGKLNCGSASQPMPSRPSRPIQSHESKTYPGCGLAAVVDRWSTRLPKPIAAGLVAVQPRRRHVSSQGCWQPGHAACGAGRRRGRRCPSQLCAAPARLPAQPNAAGFTSASGSFPLRSAQRAVLEQGERWLTTTAQHGSRSNLLCRLNAHIGPQRL